MAKTLSSAIGIDVGTKAIKIAELKAGRDRHTIAAVAIVPTPSEGIDHNGIYDPAPIVTAIKQGMAEGGIGTKQAIMGISGQSSVVVRMLEVPLMTPTEMKEHMQWEIQRNIPFAETTIVSDYARVPNPDAAPDAQQMDVVLAVAPQSAVDTVVEVLQGAGLTPIGIDVQAMAVSRLLSLGDTSGPNTVMVVNLGGSMSSIDVYRHGLLNFPRVLPLGGQNFTQAIAEALSIPMEEAEALKQAKGQVILDRFGFSDAPAPPAADAPAYQPYNPYLDVAEEGPVFEVEPEAPAPAMEPAAAGPVFDVEGDDVAAAPSVPTPVPVPVPSGGPIDDDTIRVFDAMAPLLEELTSEIRRSLEYFRGRGAGHEVTHILLMGGGGKLKGLDAFFEQALGVPSTVYSPADTFYASLRRQPLEYVSDNGPDLGVAIGLAMHAFEE